MLLLIVDLIYMGRLFGAKKMIIGIFEDTCDAEGEGDSAWDAKLQGAHCALYALHWVHRVHCALH